MNATPSPTTHSDRVLAIAKACGEQDGTRWEEVSQRQQDDDITQAEWILGIIAAAGFTIIPAAPAPTASASAP